MKKAHPGLSKYMLAVILLCAAVFLISVLTGCGAFERSCEHNYESVGATESCPDYERGVDFKCTKCGQTKYERVKGHKFGTAERVSQTCESEGYEKSKCMICGEIKSRTIPAHFSEPIGKLIVATCTSEGMTEGAKCSRCGKILEERRATPKSHSLNADKICKYCGGNFKEYNVSFVLPSEAEPIVKTCVHGSSPQFPDAPENPNAVFMGWYLNGVKCPEDFKVEADVTFVAKYEAVIDIGDIDGYKAIADNPDGFYRLANDIDFLSSPIPIIDSFGGRLFGNGHTISGFINQNNACPQTYGLFAVNDGEITDLIFTGGIFSAFSEATAGGSSVGFVCGINNGIIKNVAVKDTVVKITGKHSTGYGSSYGQLTGYLRSGVIAASNNGSISYSTVDLDVTADFNTSVYASTVYNSNGNSVRSWAYYGLIAGSNQGNIEHVTAAGTLTSEADLTEVRPDGYANYFKYIHYPLEIGGVVGRNQDGGFISDSLSEATVNVLHNVTAMRDYYGMIDAGGIVGYNSGTVERCRTGNTALLNVYVNGETRVGGVCGVNEENGVVKASCTEAQFNVGNRSAKELTYWGGIIGKNSATITHCYAVITTLDTHGFANANYGGLLGGIIGHADEKSNALSSFAVLDCSAPDVPETNLVSYYDSYRTNGAATLRCYYYATDNADGYLLLDGAPTKKCESKKDLLDEVAKLGYADIGYTAVANDYPALPDVGNAEE